MKDSQASRKYIDLILSASSKWANWDPPQRVKIGDYGDVNKDTGEFEPAGNIYDPDFEDRFRPIIAKYPPEKTSVEDRWEIVSKSVKRGELSLGPKVEVPGVAEATIQGRWQFGAKSGALLVMVNPRATYIPKTLVKQLGNATMLKDKSIVTEVVSCPAYSLYLSSGNSEAISLALVGEISLPGAPIQIGASAFKAKWWAQTAAGFCRHACDAKGEAVFTPLFSLKRLKQRWIFWRGDIEDDEPWVDKLRPWEELDDEGNEIIYEGYDSDNDDD
ncbi:hypothetical protein JAAARDRAFT_55158 [Jaapia argillacea MUCL 33604]|uniref:Uncharacterized protein n=1 Tax=Jaapia argillacea MUCL 33604 TaxID=933084 RepID=A0A067QE97_9AGAM|nr:hypothetical protein JAAARDRAFT_55158 [Jaapia argillacea MUCL 33604]